MNKEAQIEALAKLDGKYHPIKKLLFFGDKVMWWGDDWEMLPNYFEYNGIIPLIKKQPAHIYAVIDRKQGLKSSPAQLSETLLRETGNWKP